MSSSHAEPRQPAVTAIILTARLDEMVELYRRGLELPPPEEFGPDHRGFTVAPDFYLGIDRVREGDPPPPGPVSLWFTVDDVETTYRRFLALGARSKYGPTRKPWGDTLAAVFDPDGNVVGLSQRRVTSR